MLLSFLDTSATLDAFKWLYAKVLNITVPLPVYTIVAQNFAWWRQVSCVEEIPIQENYISYRYNKLGELYLVHSNPHYLTYIYTR
jgi:hypothetical protein